MNYSLTLLITVGKMLLLIAVGFVAFRKKVITLAGSRELSEILLLIVSPCVILDAFLIEYSPEKLTGFLWALLFALAAFTIRTIVSFLIVDKNADEDTKPVLRYALIFTNSGFMGIPLVLSVVPDDGVFYLTAYMMLYHIINWTLGVRIMDGKTDRNAVKKIFTNPAIIAVMVSIPIFIFSLVKFVPEVVREPLLSVIDMLANMNTPIAMFIVGTFLATSSIKSLFKVKYALKTCVLTLLVIPLAAAMIYVFVPVDKNIVLTSLISISCPIAVATSLFASRFNRNYLLASQLVTISTLLSVITIPTVVFVFEIISKFVK